MRHQRHGWRRLVALSVALVGALVIAPGIASASPSTTGVTVLDFTDCNAHVVVSWSGQPGRFKSYSVEIWSDQVSGVTVLDSGALTRSGRLDLWPTYVATIEFSNQFHALTRIYDGKGVEMDSWASNPFAANCT